MLGMSLICHINYKSLCLIRKNYFHIFSDTAENTTKFVVLNGFELEFSYLCVPNIMFIIVFALFELLFPRLTIVIPCSSRLLQVAKFKECLSLLRHSAHILIT